MRYSFPEITIDVAFIIYSIEDVSGDIGADDKYVPYTSKSLEHTFTIAFPTNPARTNN